MKSPHKNTGLKHIFIHIPYDPFRIALILAFIYIGKIVLEMKTSNKLI